MKTVTLEVGNTSWWKNRKYRREAAKELRELRLKYKRIMSNPIKILLNF